MNPQLSIPQTEIQAFCSAHAVRELSIFGSAVRGDFGADSDVDVLTKNGINRHIRDDIFHKALVVWPPIAGG